MDEEQELIGQTAYGDTVHLRVYSDEETEDGKQYFVTHSNLCGYFSASFKFMTYTGAHKLYSGFMACQEYDAS
jgi:hypothetical protein